MKLPFLHHRGPFYLINPTVYSTKMITIDQNLHILLNVFDLDKFPMDSSEWFLGNGNELTGFTRSALTLFWDNPGGSLLQLAAILNKNLPRFILIISINFLNIFSQGSHLSIFIK